MQQHSEPINAAFAPEVEFVIATIGRKPKTPEAVLHEDLPALRLYAETNSRPFTQRGVPYSPLND